MKLLFRISFFLIVISATVWGQSLLPFQDEWSGKYGFMDYEGNIVVEAAFREVNPFHDGVAIVEKDRYEYQYVRSDGQFISFSQPIYELHGFSEGIGLVTTQNGAYFYIDKSGEVISDVYDFAHPFSEGVAIVLVNEKLTVIDTSFDRQFDLPADPSGTVGAEKNYASQFHGGLLAVQNAEGKWGYIDKQGNVAIRPVFTYPGDFVGNYALTKLDDEYSDEWVIINKEGKTILSVEFPNFDFPEKHAIIHENFFIQNPARGDIRIYNLVEGSEIRVVVPEYLSGFDENIRPLLWNNHIFYDGSLISLTGEIVTRFEYKGGPDDVIWNKRYLYSDDKKLYNIEGKRFDVRLRD